MATEKEEPVAAEERAAETSAPEEAVAASNGRAKSPLSEAATIRPCPIPGGAVIFGELTSAFVDGPRLLRFLGDRRHTGAVVDSGGERAQAAVLHEGAVLGMVAAGGETTTRLDSLSLPTPGSGEEHSLTVLTYRAEVAIALGQLINLPERFLRMHGSFVDLTALLAYLEREKQSGAVRITTAEDTGIVLLRQGRVLGAYTRLHPALDDAEVVLPLGKRGDAEIDVHVGSLNAPPVGAPVHSVIR